MPYEYYDILNVKRDANMQDIKKAYRNLARELHPDKGGDEKRFQDLSNAYNVLSDVKKRREYDQNGMEGIDNRRQQQCNAHDIFQHFFRQHSNAGNGNVLKRCNDVRHNISISLEEVARGLNKQFKIKLKMYDLDDHSVCGSCNGSGQTFTAHNIGFMQQVISKGCDMCKGNGWIAKKNIKTREEECVIQLNIPVGVKDGHEIIIKGKGEQPRLRGVQAGDIIFIVHIKAHDIFTRNNNNLMCRLRINFMTSIIGTTIPLNILNLETMNIDLGSLGIIQPNKEYVFNQHGMPIMNSRERGNLYIIFDIDYPCLDEHKRERLRECLSVILQ